MTNGQTPEIQGRDVLTHSSEMTYLACPRLFYWAYERGFRPGQTARPLRFGSAFHAGLDALAKGGSALDAMADVDNTYNDIMADAAAWPNAQEAQHELEIESVTVQCLIEGYAVAWAGQQLEIVESEKTFDLPIVNPETGAASRTFRQAGKRDRIARLADGRLALMESKTTADDLADDSDYWRILGINQQLSKYLLAARADGLDVQTTIQDVVRKPSIKANDQPEVDHNGIIIARGPDGERAFKKNGEAYLTADEKTGRYIIKRPMSPDQWRKRLSADIAAQPERYYARKEIPRLDSDLAEYAAELWMIADAIRRARNTHAWFKNSGSCKRFGRLCPYIGLCAGYVSSEQDPPVGFRRVDDVHQELLEGESNANLSEPVNRQRAQ